MLSSARMAHMYQETAAITVSGIHAQVIKWLCVQRMLSYARMAHLCQEITMTIVIGIPVQ